MKAWKNSPLPSHRNHRPVIPLIIRLLLYLGAETNGTHNTIPELLIQHRLVRIPVVLHNLVQSVDERFHWWHRPRAPAVGESQ
jgi:hypothetical protein